MSEEELEQIKEYIASETEGCRNYGCGCEAWEYITDRLLEEIDRLKAARRSDGWIPNAPLTLDELRGMEESREPVWMDKSKQWGFVASVADEPYKQVWYFTARGRAQTVLYHHEIFYRRNPTPPEVTR